MLRSKLHSVGMRLACRRTSAWASCGRPTRLRSLPTTSTATSWYLTCIRAKHPTSAHCSPDKRTSHEIRNQETDRLLQDVGPGVSALVYNRLVAPRLSEAQSSHSARTESFSRKKSCQRVYFGRSGRKLVCLTGSRDPRLRYKSICLARILNPAGALWLRAFRGETFP